MPKNALIIFFIKNPQTQKLCKLDYMTLASGLYTIIYFLGYGRKPSDEKLMTTLPAIRRGTELEAPLATGKSPTTRWSPTHQQYCRSLLKYDRPILMSHQANPMEHGWNILATSWML